jgi:hypothetical protein
MGEVRETIKFESKVDFDNVAKAMEDLNNKYNKLKSADFSENLDNQFKELKNDLNSYADAIDKNKSKIVEVMNVTSDVVDNLLNAIKSQINGVDELSAEYEKFRSEAFSGINDIANQTERLVELDSDVNFDKLDASLDELRIRFNELRGADFTKNLNSKFNEFRELLNATVDDLYNNKFALIDYFDGSSASVNELIKNTEAYYKQFRQLQKEYNTEQSRIAKESRDSELYNIKLNQAQEVANAAKLTSERKAEAALLKEELIIQKEVKAYEDSIVNEEKERLANAEKLAAAQKEASDTNYINTWNTLLAERDKEESIIRQNKYLEAQNKLYEEISASTYTKGMSTDEALASLAEDYPEIEERSKKVAEQLAEEEEAVKNTAAAFRSYYAEQTKNLTAGKEYAESINKQISEARERNEAIQESIRLNNLLKNSYKEALAEAGKSAYVDLKLEDVESLSERAKSTIETLNQALQNQDDAGVRNALMDISKLHDEVVALKAEFQSLYSQGLINTTELNNATASLDSISHSMYESGSNAVNTLSENAKSKINSVLKEVADSAKKALKTTLNFAKKSISTAAKYLKKTFDSVLSSLRSKFSGLFNFDGGKLSSSISELKSLLRMYVSIYTVIRGIKSTIGYASDLVEIENVVKGSFGDMSDTIDDWAENSAEKFGLTEVQAKDFAGSFGSVAKGLGVANEQSVIMSKNLTALAGDLASFRNLDADDTFSKLSSALAGNVQALRQLGITVTKANLKTFAEEQYGAVYNNCNAATQAIIRYNYILNQAKEMNVMGDFAGTTQSWANQVRILKTRLQLLGSYIGGVFVKLLYPVVQVLNAIAEAALRVFAVLSKIFGFDTAGLTELFGGSRNYTDITDDLEDESDALDDVADSASNASDNLQGFDKLNNMTTSSSSSSGTTDASDLGIDLDSYEEFINQDYELPQWLQDFKDWLSELEELLLNKDWKGAGKKFAQGVDKVVAALYDLLTSKNTYKKLAEFNDALTDFLSTALDFDANKLGATIGAALNLLAFEINDLYDDLVNKGILTLIGQKISDFFNGLVDEVEWFELGKAFTTKFRALMDILASFLSSAESSDLATKVGLAIKDFISGAIERLFGNDGAEEIGNNIAGVINFGLKMVASALSKNEDGKTVIGELAESILTVINTAIAGINEKDLADCVSSLLTVIGEIFGMLGDIDTDDLSDKISYAINNAADDGSLESAASGIASAIINLFNLIGKTIDKIDWSSVADAILSGIGDAMATTDTDDLSDKISSAIINLFNLIGKTIDKIDWSSVADAILSGIGDAMATTDGESYLIKAFAILFGVNLVGAVGKFGLAILGKAIVNSLAGEIAGTGAAGAGVVSTIGTAIKSLLGNSLVKLGFVGAAAAVVGSTYVAYIKNIIDSEVDEANFNESLEKQAGDLTLTIDPSQYSDIFAYEDALAQLDQTYRNLGENAKIKDFKSYLNDLSKAGYEGTEAFNALKDAIDTYDDTSILNPYKKQEALDAVAKAAGDCEVQISTTLNSMKELDDVTFDNLADGWNLAVQGMQMDDATFTNFAKMAEDAVGAFCDGLSDNEKLVTATGDIIDTVTNEISHLPDEVTDYGSAVVTYIADGMNGENTILVTSSNKIYDTITGELSDLPDYFLKNGADCIIGMTEGIDTNTSLLISSGGEIYDTLTGGVAYLPEDMFEIGKDSIVQMCDGVDAQNQYLITSSGKVYDAVYQTVLPIEVDLGKIGDDACVALGTSLDTGNTIIQLASGRIYDTVTGELSPLPSDASEIGSNIDSNLSDSIWSNSGLVSSAMSNINSKINGSLDTAKSDAKTNGGYIVKGVADGISDETEGSKLKGALSSLCSAITQKFKSLLGIASPSKEMADLAQWLPKGVAVGIEDNTDSALDAMSQFSESLLSKFDTNVIDLSEIIQMNDFTEKLSIAQNQTDIFAKQMSDKLSSIQSDLVIQPSFKASEMTASVASQSTSNSIATGLANLSNKIGFMNNGNKNMNVSVYLDANNKLGDFIIDTVNGQVIKGGNF